MKARRKGKQINLRVCVYVCVHAYLHFARAHVRQMSLRGNGKLDVCRDSDSFSGTLVTFHRRKRTKEEEEETTSTSRYRRHNLIFMVVPTMCL